MKKSEYKPSEIDKYDPQAIEKKWQKVWEKKGTYNPNLDKSSKPFYNLMMFPYPSAEGMHVGNMYAFTGADVYGRFKRMQGSDVFEPIGLDGFGIHSENYAIKVGHHPVEQAKISEKTFYRQLKSIGNSFDWTRTVETYDTSYYKWTQWLFIQLFKAGLAYRKKAPVNFCPSCKTVLADEQVITKLKIKNEKLKITEEGIGVCERCETPVEKRDLEQWFFAITKYADRLLNNIDKLDWSDKVKIAQRQWIGKSEGALIRFKIKDLRLEKEDIFVEVFTTRADTLFGATFLVLSPEHPIISSLLISFAGGRLAKLKEYVQKARAKTEEERITEERKKTGMFSGLYAVNPVNNEKVPIWIADYVLMGYGTGALFGDAHDERDVEFAKKYGIPLKPTIITGDKELDKKILSLEECYTGYGTLTASSEFSGLTSKEAMKKVVKWLIKHSSGAFKTTYHLRDWLISRQRYWGPPIPMVFCGPPTGGCGWQPVPEKDLPVELPFIKDYKPLGIHSAGSGQAVKAPLASHPEFYETRCPKCGGEAKRETDVSDTFLDSAWYFLRYLATEFNDIPFPSRKFQSSVLGSQFSEFSQSVLSHPVTDKQKTGKLEAENRQPKTENRTEYWLPVNMYIGGAEHSVLHLLYSRFITMVLKDLGFINFEEPFTKFRAHGLLVKDGAKMSKSKGNVVIPDQYIKKFGADTLRTYLMFMGPFSQGGNFRDTGIEGMHRFLRRVWTLTQRCHPEFSSGSKSSGDEMLKQDGYQTVTRQVQHDTERMQMMHKTIKKVTEDIEGLNYNTAIAALMEWYNYLSSKLKVENGKLAKEEIEAFLKLLAPFAPHVSEELWSRLSVISQSGKLITDKLGSENRQQKTDNWSIHHQSWPNYNPKFLVKDKVVIVVEVNGRLRGNIVVDLETSKNKAKIEELAKKDSNVAKHLEAKGTKKVIFVEGKVINFVV